MRLSLGSNFKQNFKDTNHVYLLTKSEVQFNFKPSVVVGCLRNRGQQISDANRAFYILAWLI